MNQSESGFKVKNKEVFSLVSPWCGMNLEAMEVIVVSAHTKFIAVTLEVKRIFLIQLFKIQ
jgi:hypothetical protein